MNYYLLLVSPMDQVFVGPYSIDHVAVAAADYIVLGHNAYIFSETQKRQNEKDYGPLPLQAPAATIILGNEP